MIRVLPVVVAGEAWHMLPSNGLRFSETPAANPATLCLVSLLHCQAPMSFQLRRLYSLVPNTLVVSPVVRAVHRLRNNAGIGIVPCCVTLLTCQARLLNKSPWVLFPLCWDNNIWLLLCQGLPL